MLREIRNMIRPDRNANRSLSRSVTSRRVVDDTAGAVKTTAVEQPISSHQVVQKLRCWLHAGYQQMIAGAGARHVKQVSLAVVDFFEIRIVRDILDALSTGDRKFLTRQ